MPDLTLHAHPLSSYCWKVLIALYEAGTAFTFQHLDLADPSARAEFYALWPIGKMPVLVDATAGRTVAETSVIIEYLERYAPAARRMLPTEPEEALTARFWDRFCDLYLSTPMQKVVGDRIRPEGSRDPFGVDEARRTLDAAFGVLEAHMQGREWAAGSSFGLADCAASPALFYADQIASLRERPVLAAYLARLAARPSFARVLDEAGPWMHNFPRENRP
ncbi:glutathione S-transferase family protein [Nannocystis bainbridge]|uniref:Glutathione S-transferase family protein n=1 Tax=Nannocystis bainbridge TaxID=2995303 RepID=A0ABT5DS93_9BACT|nr:glutathione S-transferase family protein [Nannocystis bainbridge]MDC0715593.1 glutathione S-transferase family protein [Nannocystis bainbridge]